MKFSLIFLTIFFSIFFFQILYAQTDKKVKSEITIRDIYDKIEKLTDDVDKKFDKMDKLKDDVDKKFDKIEIRLNHIDTQIAKYDERFNSVKGDLDRQFYLFGSVILLAVGAVTFFYKKLSEMGERIAIIETRYSKDGFKYSPTLTQVTEEASQFDLEAYSKELLKYSKDLELDPLIPKSLKELNKRIINEMLKMKHSEQV